MRTAQLIGAVIAFIVSVYVGRIVLHALTDHGHLDLFHLVVAAVVAMAGSVLLYRALMRPSRAG